MELKATVKVELVGADGKVVASADTEVTRPDYMPEGSKPQVSSMRSLLQTLNSAVRDHLPLKGA